MKTQSTSQVASNQSGLVDVDQGLIGQMRELLILQLQPMEMNIKSSITKEIAVVSKKKNESLSE